MFGRSELWCSVEFRGVLGLCEYLQTLQILEIWLGWGVGVVQRSRFLSIWAYPRAAGAGAVRAARREAARRGQAIGRGRHHRLHHPCRAGAAGAAAVAALRQACGRRAARSDRAGVRGGPSLGHRRAVGALAVQGG